jgi:hypothetical protein
MKIPDDIAQIQDGTPEKGEASAERAEVQAPEGLGHKSSRAITCFFPAEVYSGLHRIKEERGYPNMASVVLRACELFIRDRKRGRRI